MVMLSPIRVYAMVRNFVLAAAIASSAWVIWSEEAKSESVKEPRAVAAVLWDGSESVANYAKRVNLPATQTLDLGNGVKLELVLIPAGRFIMGTPEPKEPIETVAVGQGILYLGIACMLGLVLVVLFHAIRKRLRPKFSLRFLMMLTLVASAEVYGGVRWHKTELAWQEYEAAKARYDAAQPDEKPGHPVILTHPFYMGKYDVIQEQYRQLIGSNPSYFIGKNNPVEMVSWDDAVAFCKKLAEQTKQAVRLPTEAEWEYACRAGTTTTYDFSVMPDDLDLDRVAWYGANSNYTTHPVGQKEPNAFGLYDMHGNVWQWCQDWYAEDYYGKNLVVNPQGPAQGDFRVLRGSSWRFVFSGYTTCRSAYLSMYDMGINYEFGFRITLVPAFRTPF